MPAIGLTTHVRAPGSDGKGVHSGVRCAHALPAWLPGPEECLPGTPGPRPLGEADSGGPGAALAPPNQARVRTSPSLVDLHPTPRHRLDGPQGSLRGTIPCPQRSTSPPRPQATRTGRKQLEPWPRRLLLRPHHRHSLPWPWPRRPLCEPAPCQIRMILSPPRVQPGPTSRGAPAGPGAPPASPRGTTTRHLAHQSPRLSGLPLCPRCAEPHGKPGPLQRRE
mmetsp:Transcript_17684/g.51695  ORF Transcript_17684/g.51695 Transcript_17684/m.51695 type:complete len:222 (-) Transcript_17684:330-995(-)